MNQSGTHNTVRRVYPASLGLVFHLSGHAALIAGDPSHCAQCVHVQIIARVITSVLAVFIYRLPP